MKLNSALIQPQRPLLSAPVPLAFNFNATSRRPLIPLTAVAFLLDKTHAQVIELIEEGKIRWAFDIRSSGKTHREIRVLRHSLLQLIGFHAPADSPIAEDFPADDAREFDEIIKLILPPGFVLSPATLSGRPAAALSKPTLSARLLSLSIRSNSVSPTSLFPQEPVLRGTEIAQAFTCISQHVLNLLRQNSLRGVNLRRSPKATPFVLRSSVVEFLRARRIQ